MTFLEAAIAILKREGKPLHFKKLTEIAVRDNLLTVVGRTPEATMQQRLNDAMKKDPSLPLTRDKPGVFGLRWYPEREAVVGGAEAGDRANGQSGETGDDGAAKEAAAKPERAAGEPRPEGEGGKRRRRRGGRGRRRREGGAEAGAATVGEGASPPVGDEDEAAEEIGSTEADAIAAAVGEESEPFDEPPLPAPAPTASSDDDGEEEDDEDAEGEGAEEPAAARSDAALLPPPGQPARLSFAEAAAAVAAAHGREPRRWDAPRAEGAERPVEVSAAPPSVEAPEGAEPVEGADEDEEAALADSLDAHSGPTIAPSFGTEEVVKGEDHRPVYEGDRRPRRERERDRGRGGRRDRHEARGPQDQPRRDEPRRDEPRRDEPRRDEPRRDEPRRDEPRRDDRPAQAGAREGLGPVEAVVEVLRAGDGRPMHFRQLVDVALKRRLLRGEPPELWRVTRAAGVLEQRSREAAGLRPRARLLGSGNLGAADRRLDGELAQYERELGERAARLSEATRVALHRRLARLAPVSFEALARLLLERMGVAQVESVKRGDGVLYLGGERARGARRTRVLVSVRAGEGELSRRAIGELRAGLKARGFDEGILLAAGRAGDEAWAEMAAGAGPVELYDGEALASLCARLGVGVVRRAVAVETLDIELLGELSEG